MHSRRRSGLPTVTRRSWRFPASSELQPAALSAPRWADWEQLRCTLLSRLSRHQELTRRVAALPPDIPDKVGRPCVTSSRENQLTASLSMPRRT
ncbi:MAG: hypothetical protein ABIS45_03230 [Burkholderiales bacterium]